MRACPGHHAVPPQRPSGRYALSVNGPIDAMLFYALGMFAGGFAAWLLFRGIVRADLAGRRSINRARGADRPDWAPGIWHCASCLSTNSPAATRCASCRRPRQDLQHTQTEPRPDWIPAHIAVPPVSLVTLLHDPAAHTDPGSAHWRLTVSGRTAGSAATRDGALAILRALDGVDEVRLDVRGTGAVAYRLGDVIDRFASDRFPLDVPCPEAGR